MMIMLCGLAIVRKRMAELEGSMGCWAFFRIDNCFHHFRCMKPWQIIPAVLERKVAPRPLTAACSLC